MNGLGWKPELSIPIKTKYLCIPIKRNGFGGFWWVDLEMRVGY